MDYKLQIISLVTSFVFGILFSMLVETNYHLISKQKKWLQKLLTFIFIIDIVLLYLIIIYFINGGQFHLYFILLIALGYYIADRRLKMLSKRLMSIKLIAKLKNKCYTSKVGEYKSKGDTR